MRRLSLLVLVALPLLLLARQPAAAQTQQRVFLPLLASRALVASYLGGAGADAVSATAFDAAGRLLLAGRFAEGPIAGVSAASLPGGEGAVIRLTAGGSAVSSAARVGGNVRDMEASASGGVLACGDFGLAVLQADLAAVSWRAAPGAAERCAIGASGAVAALVGKRVFTYAADGTAGASWEVAGSAVADLAIDDVRGMVFATGYTQKSTNLKVAFLRAYGLDGALRWSAYDFANDAVLGAGLSADSEGRRVAMGADEKLYFAGFTDGGNSIYGRYPLDMGRRLSGAELVKFDGFNDPYNISGAKALAWYGRFDPASGALLRGQWLLTRLSDGKGNSIGISAIAADADGTLAIAGDAAFALPNRAGMSFAGVALGAYELGEPYLLVVSPDMSARRLWTALAAPGTSAGGSPATGVAIRNGLVAMGATLNPRATAPARGLVTAGAAPQPANASPNATEGYFLLIQP